MITWVLPLHTQSSFWSQLQYSLKCRWWVYKKTLKYCLKSELLCIRKYNKDITGYIKWRSVTLFPSASGSPHVCLFVCPTLCLPRSLCDAPLHYQLISTGLKLHLTPWLHQSAPLAHTSAFFGSILQTVFPSLPLFECFPAKPLISPKVHYPCLEMFLFMK